MNFSDAPWSLTVDVNRSYLMYDLTLTFISPVCSSVQEDRSGEGKGGRCVRLTTLPHICADCLEIFEASISRRIKSLSKPFVEIVLPWPWPLHEGQTYNYLLYSCMTKHIDLAELQVFCFWKLSHLSSTTDHRSTIRLACSNGSACEINRPTRSEGLYIHSSSNYCERSLRPNFQV
jgi:hypothetical protein